MLVEAILTKSDLEHVVAQFLPATVQIDGGTLTLDGPYQLSLVPDHGLRIACRAHLHWPVMGVHVPVDVEPLTAMLSPAVEVREGNETLVFVPSIVHADIRLSPTIVDNAITAKLNEALAAKHVELAWNFRRTLSHAFDLPESIESSSAIALEVKLGVVKVTENAIALGVTFTTAVRRRNNGDDTAGLPGKPRPPRDGSTNGSAGPNDTKGAAPGHGTGPVPVLATGGLMASVALAAAFGLGRLSKR
jgi:hypothetical protein